jgi:formyltetrahydrofolate-dependent phosphoribosylglycinamide formyltransferase
VNRARVGVLASGGGSNLQSLLDHARALGEARAFDVVLVASDRPDAGALTRARDADVPSVVLASRHAPEGASLADALSAHGVDLLVLAGFLKLVPPEVTRRYAGRLLNVHPALLPDFGGPGMYGARVHRAVLAAGAQVSGPTVHFVDEEYDHGAAIAGWRVPVLAGDDEHTLAARVLRAEHLLFPRIVDAVASGAIKLAPDGRVAPPFDRLSEYLPTFDPELNDASLALALDRALAR